MTGIPPSQVPRPLDSLNWRVPSPNHPILCWSLSPPPQSPPTPPISPLPPMPPKTLTRSQLTHDLISLIKTTLEALQNIVHIAERLLHQANAECHLAHKSWQMTWSSHKDTCGNTVCPQPPVFPSWRGVPVTGSLGGSDPIPYSASRYPIQFPVFSYIRYYQTFPPLCGFSLHFVRMHLTVVFPKWVVWV